MKKFLRELPWLLGQWAGFMMFAEVWRADMADLPLWLALPGYIFTTGVVTLCSIKAYPEGFFGVGRRK